MSYDENMFEVKDMPDMRSNKVWDEETAERAGLPVVSEGNEKQDNVFELNDNKDKKDGFLEGSLAAAEAVQDETDKRRSAAVTKSNLKDKCI